jgi:DNA mismatch repair protein MSH4
MFMKENEILDAVKISNAFDVTLMSLAVSVGQSSYLPIVDISKCTMSATSSHTEVSKFCNIESVNLHPYSMAGTTRGPTSYSTHSFSNYTTANGYNSISNSRPKTSHSVGRPSVARPRTGKSSVYDGPIVCAVTESRGVSPTVGIALLNLASGEAVLSQISDTQSYVRTIQKLAVFEPSEILVPTYATNMISKLNMCIEENLSHLGALKYVNRRYFAETAGLEYIQKLAFSEDIEAIKVSVSGNYFAVCCFSAVS